jgi:hypothetical protein
MTRHHVVDGSPEFHPPLVHSRGNPCSSAWWLLHPVRATIAIQPPKMIKATTRIGTPSRSGPAKYSHRGRVRSFPIRSRFVDYGCNVDPRRRRARARSHSARLFPLAKIEVLHMLARNIAFKPLNTCSCATSSARLGLRCRPMSSYFYEKKSRWRPGHRLQELRSGRESQEGGRSCSHLTGGR